MKFYQGERELGEVVQESDDRLLFTSASYRMEGGLVVSLETDLPDLYKKNKKGKWQTMKIWLDVGNGATICSSIATDGEKTRTFKTPVKPVASKSLSTVCQEKLLSKWNKKKNRDGWIDDKDAPQPLQEPLLLHHWDEYKKKIRYPAIISPKYNGIRSTYKASIMRLLSRKRNEFSLPHIERELAQLNMTVDGELWHPELTFEEITSLVKRGGPSKICYYIFDRPGKSRSYPERIKEVMTRVGEMEFLKVADMAIVQDEMEAEAYFEVLKKIPGCDGAVIRNIEYSYEFDIRSYDVLKMKDILSKEYTLQYMNGDPDELGEMAQLVFQTEDGQQFKVTPNMSKKDRVELYQDYLNDPPKYQGKDWTLEFREYTTKGLPKHILTTTERNYE